MKSLLVGGMSMSGIGKESGKPYAMHQIFTLLPVQVFSDAKRTVKGFGMEISACDATEAVIAQLSALSPSSFPAYFEIEQEQRNFAGKAQFVVIGAKPVAK